MKNINPARSGVKLQTLKGFRDFLPKEARKRQYVANILIKVFESYGFEPLETPALEYEEILLGKYGEEGDKLMYRFEDLGKRKVALRYDQTVPLARVIAQYQNDLPMPFKRYQIQNVWRAENTQRGRYREFLQCDADIVGSSSPFSDAEIITVAADSLKKLGFKNFKILVNDRSVFSSFDKFGSLPEKDLSIVVKAIDKLKKIGEEKVLDELIRNGIEKERATYILQALREKKPTPQINEILDSLKKLGLSENEIEFLPTLARGLDYYTGMIFEVEIDGYTAGSVAGGGRYDNLIGLFAKKLVPAVGFAFGFDRLIETMDALSLFPQNLITTKVLVTIFSNDLKEKSFEIYQKVRNENINCEIYLDENTPLEKQLKYADKKGIPYAIIIGPEEAKNNTVTLKNLKTGEQKITDLEQITKQLGTSN